jgi:hypothetical protein
MQRATEKELMIKFPYGGQAPHFLAYLMIFEFILYNMVMDYKL